MLAAVTIRTDITIPAISPALRVCAPVRQAKLFKKKMES